MTDKLKKVFSVLLVFALTLCIFPKHTAKGATAEQIINSATLEPIRTGYAELDSQIDKIFADGFTSKMTPYDKVWYLYQYMVKTFEYDNSYLIYISRDIYPILEKVPYKSTDDAYEVFRALRILRLKVGACTYYSSLFMIMLRAIGFDAYTVTGETSKASGGWTGHTWVSVKINGVWYNFDPQVEDNITNRTADKVIGKYRFCKTDEELKNKIRKFNRENDVAEFGKFSVEGLTAPMLNGMSDGKRIYVYSGGSVSLIPDISEKNNNVTYNVYICNGYTEKATEIKEAECIGNGISGNELSITLTSPGEYSVLLEATDGEYTSSAVFHIEGVNVYQCPPEIMADGIQALLDDETAFITDKDGNTKTDSFIGTGDIINSEQHSMYFAYVSGDTDGDGRISSTDYIRIKSAFLNTFTFDTLFSRAADYNNDNFLDTSDYLAIKSLLLNNN